MIRFIRFLLITNTIIPACFGQISITKISPKFDTEDVAPYDSNQNFLGSKVHKYVGQVFYCKGKDLVMRPEGYTNFYDSVEDSEGSSGKYKCCNNYHQLAGKYFKVVSVVKHPKAKGGEISYEGKYYLKLQETNNGDIVYYEYDWELYSLIEFPFIVVGFYKKLKDRAIGRRFVYREIETGFVQNKRDVLNGREIIFTDGAEWECIDVTIEDQQYTLVMLYKDNTGQTITIDYEEWERITNTQNSNNEEIASFADQMPVFIGGQEAMFKFLSANLSVPKDENGKNILGRVILTLVVTKSGKIARVENLSKNADPLLVAEAIKAINKMPDWIPGKQNGRPINTRYTMPIEFK